VQRAPLHTAQETLSPGGPLLEPELLLELLEPELLPELLLELLPELLLWLLLWLLPGLPAARLTAA
jgi:hypothetical protein